MLLGSPRRHPGDWLWWLRHAIGTTCMVEAGQAWEIQMPAAVPIGGAGFPDVPLNPRH